MKIIKLFLFAVICLAVAGCGKFRDGSSVWQDGLWILPWIAGLLCLFCGYNTYIDWQSGWQQDDLAGHTEGKKKLPLYKIPYFWFTVILFVATIVIIWVVNAEK